MSGEVRIAFCEIVLLWEMKVITPAEPALVKLSLIRTTLASNLAFLASPLLLFSFPTLYYRGDQMYCLSWQCSRLMTATASSISSVLVEGADVAKFPLCVISAGGLATALPHASLSSAGLGTLMMVPYLEIPQG